MNFNYECLHCHINQVLKVSKFVNLEASNTEKLMRSVLNDLSKYNYHDSNPELMGYTWNTICSHINNDRPYKSFNEKYNSTLMSISDSLDLEIKKTNTPFTNYLYAAILGNIIDLGPSHFFEGDNWLQRFTEELAAQSLAIDDSYALKTEIESASNLLYIGDNCGEIVLDHLFIKYLKKTYPALNITFSVRGTSVLNDATLYDADYIGLTNTVKVISDGTATPGISMSQASKEFKDIFKNANVIIAKGQGNFEGLSHLHDSRVFHLFMAKCDLVARIAGVPIMSKLCYRLH